MTKPISQDLSYIYHAGTTAGLPIGDNNIVDKKNWVRHDNGTSLHLYWKEESEHHT